MSDVIGTLPTPDQEIDRCIAQHQRAGCTLVCREDNPPRARMRMVIKPANRVSREAGEPSITTPRKVTYLEITIGHGGHAVWARIPCTSGDYRDATEPRVRAIRVRRVEAPGVVDAAPDAKKAHPWWRRWKRS